MICKNCGTELNNDAKFCLGCGAPVEAPVVPPVPPVVPPVPPVPDVVIQNSAPQGEDSLPEQYRPLGAWAYFGLQILFSIPIVGFIFLIVFSCSSGNINRRNFARSYWCGLIIFAAIALIVILFVVLLGGGFAALAEFG